MKVIIEQLVGTPGRPAAFVSCEHTFQYRDPVKYRWYFGAKCQLFFARVDLRSMRILSSKATPENWRAFKAEIPLPRNRHLDQ